MVGGQRRLEWKSKDLGLYPSSLTSLLHDPDQFSQSPLIPSVKCNTHPLPCTRWSRDQRKQRVHKHRRRKKETQLSAQLTFIRFQTKTKNLLSVMGKLRKNKRQALSSRNFQSNREGNRKMAGKLGVHGGPSNWYIGRGIRAGL